MSIALQEQLLHALLETSLHRVARRSHLNPKAVSDVAARAIEEKAFMLSKDNKILPVTAANLEAWLEGVLSDAPFYREKPPETVPTSGARIYGRVGDGDAARRLEIANGETPEDIL